MKVDDFIKDDQPRSHIPVCESSSSGSSSRSDSPDTWKPPCTGSASSPESNDGKTSTGIGSNSMTVALDQSQQSQSGDRGAQREIESDESKISSDITKEKDSSLIDDKKEQDGVKDQSKNCLIFF